MDVKKDANKEMGGRKNFCVLIVMEAGGVTNSRLHRLFNIIYAFKCIIKSLEAFKHASFLCLCGRTLNAFICNYSSVSSSIKSPSCTVIYRFVTLSHSMLHFANVAS